MKLAVITRVADPAKGEYGNFAWADDVYVENGRASEATGWLAPVAPAVNRLGIAALELRTPVFRVGELLVLNANDRDQFGRKPDKWDVDLEEFDDPQEAMRKALELTA